MTKLHFVYLLLCSDNTLYCGYTINIENRLKAHNRSPSGAKYTKTRRPVVLVYFEELPDIASALKRERLIKTWPRIKKEKLITSAQVETCKKIHMLNNASSQ